MNTPLLLSVLSVILSLGVNSPAFAQTAKANPPATFKVTGRGIQNDDSGEMILLTCVGASLTSQEPDCDTLQLLQLKSDAEPTLLGNAFHAGDLPQIREELTKTYSEQSVEGVFSFLKGDSMYALTDQNGWNWSNNPLRIESKKFSKVVATVLYFAEYQHSLENEKARRLSTQEKMAFEQGISGYRGVFVAQVKERDSNRTLIYSLAENDMVISLSSHGKSVELKSLKIIDHMDRIELAGSNYHFEIMKKMAKATKNMFNFFVHIHYDEDGNDVTAVVRECDVLASLITGGIALGSVTTTSATSAGTIAAAIAIGVAAPTAALGVVIAGPVIAGALTIGVDGAITLVSNTLGTRATAKRKFHKLMSERNVHASRRVFNSMIEQIKAL